MKITGKLKSSEGSSTIEAALIFPILILIIYGIFKIAIAYYEKVILISEEKLILSHSELILRSRWTLF